MSEDQNGVELTSITIDESTDTIDESTVSHFQVSSERRFKKATMQSSALRIQAVITSPRLVLTRWFFFVLFLLLLCAAYFFILFYIYATIPGSPLARVGRNGDLVFLTICILFLLVILYLTCRWRRIAEMWIRTNYERKSVRKSKKNGDNWFKKLYQMYQLYFDLDGRAYLAYMYLGEVVDMFVNVYNFQTIYLCSVPVSISLTLAGLFVLEGSQRLAVIGRHLRPGKQERITVSERNREVGLNVIVSLSLLLIPPAIIYLVFEIRLPVNEMLFLVVFPARTLFFYLRRLGKEAIHRRVDALYFEIQKTLSSRGSRSRRSIYGPVKQVQIAQVQNHYFPRRAKIVVFCLTVLYVGFFTAIGIIHSIQYRSGDERCGTKFHLHNFTTNLWKDGCSVKLLFCENAFAWSCGCSSVSLRGHDLVSLPVKPMTSSFRKLRSLVLTHGPLRTFPKEMERMSLLSNIDLDFNQLESFEVDLRKLPNMLRLQLQHNKIQSYHALSLWTHESLVILRLNDNVNVSLPEQIYDGSSNTHVKPRMESLYFLSIVNNSSPLPRTLERKQFPRLLYFYAGGNNVGSAGEFPLNFETFAGQLQKLSVARWGLSKLPDYLSSFKLLRYLDVRNNSLTSIPQTLESFLMTRKELYLGGNPLCLNSPLTQCESVCSDYCFTRLQRNDRFCDHSCNSQQCQFDGGDCVYNKS